MKITEFKCENLSNNLVTDNLSPKFRFCADEEILSASIELNGEKFDCMPPFTKYDGILKPFSEYEATLTVVGKTGTDKKSVKFMTGRSGAPWVGKFITVGDYKFKEKKTSPLTMVFRKDFSLGKKVKRAVIYATAIGVFELTLNGKKVGDDYFAPGFTSYKHTLQYAAYDITDRIRDDNAVYAEVVGGWAVGSYIFTRKNKITAKRQSFLAEIRIEYLDGTMEIIPTDASWGATIGNEVRADLYDGEVVDARVDIAKLNYKPAAIEKVKIHPEIIAAKAGFVKKHEEMLPISCKEVGDELVFDFGQNFAGIVAFTIKNGTSGDVITVKHAEILNRDGTPNTAFLRSAKARIVYTCRDGEQFYSPRFTYMGFRYVSVVGVKKDDIELKAYALYSDLDTSGHFECSDEMINKLNSNILWSAKSNFVDIPTDCPQRDERMGWTGDIAMFSPTACYNFDMSAFLDKWLTDLASEQLPSGGTCNTAPVQGYGFPATMPHMAVDFWGDAIVLVPYNEYMARGDIDVLKKYYPAMKKYVKACKFWAGLFSVGKRRYIWHTPAVFHFGDWVSPDAPKMSDWQKRSKWTATASLFNTSSTLAKIAKILRYDDDEKYYCKLSKKVADAYVSVLTDDGKLKKEFQTGYVLPLQFGMFNEEQAAFAADNLNLLVEKNSYRIATGVPGTPYVLSALADNGHIDTAYKMLLCDDCPSWLYEVKVGATTVWERWDALTEDGLSAAGDDGTGGMVSFNHYMFGSVGYFLYSHVLGIEPTSGGYKTFNVKPIPGGGLTYAKGDVITPYGKICIDWKLNDDNFKIAVTVPFGTSCSIYLPDGSFKTLDGGKYDFECKIS